MKKLFSDEQILELARTSLTEEERYSFDQSPHPRRIAQFQTLATNIIEAWLAQQTPVAWMADDGRIVSSATKADVPNSMKDVHHIPLFLAPPTAIPEGWQQIQADAERYRWIVSKTKLMRRQLVKGQFSEITLEIGADTFLNPVFKVDLNGAIDPLMLDCKDTAVSAKWWESGNEALDQHRELIGKMERRLNKCTNCRGTGEVGESDDGANWYAAPCPVCNRSSEPPPGEKK